MKLEAAELKNIERIVVISKTAFDSDIDVGASETDRPPEYASVTWHIQMQNEGHLFLFKIKYTIMAIYKRSGILLERKEAVK